jgi:exopolyphosphatase/guanosine-5'-triphosphate,3'-diphosphate pyrophosphatase
MRVGVIDCGTNTFNLLIAEKQKHGFSILSKSKRIVRLGKAGINKNILLDDALDRAQSAILSFKKTLLKHNAIEVYCFATSAVREASNQSKFNDIIKNNIGILPTVIDGIREAELIYKGIKYSGILDEQTSLIMDIGGGSVEFVFCTQDKILWSNSYKIGGARLMQLLKPSDPINEFNIVDMRFILVEELKTLFDACIRYKPLNLIGSSGSFETFATMIEKKLNPSFSLSRKKYYHFNLDQFNQIHEQLIRSTYLERLKMPGMLRMRADMIVIASLLTKFIIEELSIRQLDLSTYSLKEGALFEIFNT